MSFRQRSSVLKNKNEKIQELISLCGIGEDLLKGTFQSLELIETLMRQGMVSGGDLALNTAEKIKQDFLDTLQRNITKLLDEEFTEQEIDELLIVFRLPVTRRFLQKIGSIGNKAYNCTLRQIATRVEESMEQFPVSEPNGLHTRKLS
jgi:uncharacterized protein YoaH (UPF0181 family)